MVARPLVAFASAVLIFHLLPALVGDPAADWIDLVTPFAVLGAAALVLRAVAARGLPVVAAAAAAILYVDGHGIHLAANSIKHEHPRGDVLSVANFWDEDWGHFEWHLGLFILVAALCLAARGAPVSLTAGIATAVLLGFTFFTITVEGGTWWLELAATAAFVPWALRARRPVLSSCAGAYALGAMLIGIWAVWQGGVPEFSDIGWI
ncbi:MAG TPA: hypothetical protein VGJ77_02365 [Gaiellaceae bacterium]|jgi:hypothetical protein